MHGVWVDWWPRLCSILCLKPCDGPARTDTYLISGYRVVRFAVQSTRQAPSVATVYGEPEMVAHFVP